MFDISYFIADTLNKPQSIARDLLFKPNELKMATDRLLDNLTYTLTTSDNHDDERILAMARAFDDALRTDAGSFAKDMIESAATQIANTLQNALSDISESVRPTVEDLLAKIVTIKNDYIARQQGAIESITAENDPEISMKDLDWGRLAVPAYTKSLESLAKTLNAGITKDHIGELVPLMDKARRVGDIPAIEITNIEEVAQKVVELSDNLTIADVHFGLLYTSSPKANLLPKMKSMEQDIYSRDHVKFVKETTELVHMINETIMTISDHRDNIPMSDTVLTNLVSNSLKIGTRLQYTEICAAIIRDTMKDTLILDRKTINPDAKAEFISKGGSDKQIADYLYVNYKRKNRPVTARIKTVAIESAVENTENTITEIRNDAVANVSAIVGKGYQIAIDQVFTHYSETLQDTKETAAERNRINLVNKEFVDNVVSFSGRDEALEDYLYEYVIKMNHGEGLLYTLYKRMAGGLIDLAKTSDGQITDGDVLKVNQVTVSEIVAEFMVTNLCE